MEECGRGGSLTGLLCGAPRDGGDPLRRKG